MVADTFIRASKHSCMGGAGTHLASPLVEEIIGGRLGKDDFFFFEGFSVVNDPVAGPIPMCTWPILTGLSSLKGCRGGMK